MKKALNFVCNTKKGQVIMLVSTVGMLIALVIGLILGFPIFWMGGKGYQATWMNSIDPYFFIPFGIFVVLFLFLFVPYMFFIAYSSKYEGNGRMVLKGMAIFCSIIPGGVIYGFIAKALLIPNGIYFLAGVPISGLVYLWVMRRIFKKPFSITQEFLPLC